MNDDLISRKAAIDAICEECHMETDYHRCEGYKKDSRWCEYSTALNDLPSAQPEVLAHGEGELSAQPEIIRCKECIYFDKYIDCKEMYQWDGFCADWARNTYENWYCSRAERRNDV